MTDWVPEIDPAVAVERLDSEVVVYQPRERMLTVLNSSAALVWEFCDGSRTVAELVARVASEVGVGAGDIETDVAAFLQDARARGLIRTAGPASTRPPAGRP